MVEVLLITLLINIYSYNDLVLHNILIKYLMIVLCAAMSVTLVFTILIIMKEAFIRGRKEITRVYSKKEAEKLGMARRN